MAATNDSSQSRNYTGFRRTLEPVRGGRVIICPASVGREVIEVSAIVCVVTGWWIEPPEKHAGEPGVHVRVKEGSWLKALQIGPSRLDE